jgi:murein DD-endopeptidase MepM/ murein hydrolase activator NlpD
VRRLRWSSLFTVHFGLPMANYTAGPRAKWEIRMQHPQARPRASRPTAERRAVRASLAALVLLLGLLVEVGGAAGDGATVARLTPRAPAPGASRAPAADPDGIAIGDLPLRRVAAQPQVVTKGELARGQTLSAALRSQGISSQTIHVVAREMRPVFDFRHAQPGDRYRLSLDDEGGVVDFRYSTSSLQSYHLFRAGEGFIARPEAAELHPRVARIAGVVRSSLYEAVRSLGEDPQLAGEFAGLFAWDIDFRSVQPGDEFRILYERLYRMDDRGGEHYVRPGRILAARYRGATGEHTAVYFETDENKGGYYRADGGSIEREFLVAPLRYSRVSSGYSFARRHPILHVTRPHRGIDYAAPTGTPVWAVADGKVIYRGWAGGFGNLVKIQHVNGYVSYYGHLSKFAPGLRVGQKVSQKEVIGFVGSTGLATGPHVCFRIAKDGQYVNPLKLKSPAGEPIADEYWVDFQIVRDTLLSELDGTTLVATDEAL